MLTNLTIKNRQYFETAYEKKTAAENWKIDIQVLEETFVLSMRFPDFHTTINSVAFIRGFAEL